MVRKVVKYTIVEPEQVDVWLSNGWELYEAPKEMFGKLRQQLVKYDTNE